MRRNLRLALLAAGLALITAIVMIVMWFQPPGTLSIAAGQKGGAYHQIADRYREVLARDGITVEIVETAGSVANADLIAAGKVDAAIVQGGVEIPPGPVEAVGKVFFEPLIFLAHAEAEVPANPAEWSGLRINVGARGSGTAATWADFEAAVGLDPAANTRLRYPYYRAIAELESGALDLAFFVAPIEAPYLQKAYHDPAITLLPLNFVEALSRRLGQATTVTVPAGAISLLPARPPVPRELIALEARLLIRESLHPALVNRLTMAAIELHQKRGMITAQGAFPSVEGVGVPVNNAARQVILSGPAVWYDWLPYWLASQVHRVILLIVPILFVLLPLLRIVPAGYAHLMRWRVWTHYPEIRKIEHRLDRRQTAEALDDMDDRLVRLDERLARLGLPVAYRQVAYDARLHIDLVRNRIDELREELRGPAAAD